MENLRKVTPTILISDYDEKNLKSIEKTETSVIENNDHIFRARTTHVKSILKKSSVESSDRNDHSDDYPVVTQQPRIRKKTVFKGPILRVQVFEQLCDENNNNNEEFKPNCWYKFLSVVCAWRVRKKNFYLKFFSVRSRKKKSK